MNTDLSILSLQKHRDLLQMEYEYDKKCFEHQSGFMSVDKKVAAGICRYPISIGRSYYNSLDQYVVEIHARGCDEEDDHFEYGRSVDFFTVSMTDEVRPIKVTGPKKEQNGIGRLLLSLR